MRLPRDAGVALAAASVALAAAAAVPLALAGLLALPAGLALAARRAARAAEAYPVRLPVDRVAHAICDAYVALGELRDEARRSLAFEPRSSGFVRVYLAAADAAESERFAVALEQALGPPSAGGWWISRPVAVPRGLARPRWRQALAGRAQLDSCGSAYRTTSAAGATGGRPMRPPGRAGSAIASCAATRRARCSPPRTPATTRGCATCGSDASRGSDGRLGRAERRAQQRLVDAVRRAAAGRRSCR